MDFNNEALNSPKPMRRSAACLVQALGFSVPVVSAPIKKQGLNRPAMRIGLEQLCGLQFPGGRPDEQRILISLVINPRHVQLDFRVFLVVEIIPAPDSDPAAFDLQFEIFIWFDLRLRPPRMQDGSVSWATTARPFFLAFGAQRSLQLRRSLPAKAFSLVAVAN